MRYLGNKDAVLDEIYKMFLDKGIFDDSSILFDAFSGTASVGNLFKNRFKIIANDYLYLSYVYSYGRLNNSNINYEKLGFDPFNYFNSEPNCHFEGFFTNNYSPKGQGNRMYFSNENAERIDFIRTTIEDWKNKQKISDKEYFYLLASLLESVSKVANVAGVYGAYLKKWDPRALKTMKLIEIDATKGHVDNHEIYCDKLENIVSNIECDVIYLDPPYTKNQYSVQYHILETLAKYDNPPIKGITGGRDQKGKQSDWSVPGKAEILFDYVVSKTKAKHLVLSYSSDGIISKEFIESVLKRYGFSDTYEFRKLKYKKYRNHRTFGSDDHFEYLFYIKLKNSNDVIYSSPLNYMGGKSDMVKFIMNNAPKSYSKFIDLFGGGFNVGINSSCQHVIYNDCNFKVKQLIEMFKDLDTYDLYKYLKENIKKRGLTKNGKAEYLEARKEYNHPEPPLRDSRLLYLLVLYGFQQQIRFNSSLEYNNPVGESGFNEKILEKIISFSRVLKEKKPHFFSDDFSEFRSMIDSETFVYCDPPYLITLGSYNDGKRGFNGWSSSDEIRLHEFLDDIDKLGGKFMLSNVIEHKGKVNFLILDWINRRNYKILQFNGGRQNRRSEIVIINYEVNT